MLVSETGSSPRLPRFGLAHQPAVGREQWVEFQCAEKRMIAEVEADEGAELDNLVVAVVAAQLIENAASTASGLTDINSL